MALPVIACKRVDCR